MVAEKINSVNVFNFELKTLMILSVFVSNLEIVNKNKDSGQIICIIMKNETCIHKFPAALQLSETKGGNFNCKIWSKVSPPTHTHAKKAWTLWSFWQLLSGSRVYTRVLIGYIS